MEESGGRGMGHLERWRLILPNCHKGCVHDREEGGMCVGDGVDGGHCCNVCMCFENKGRRGFISVREKERRSGGGGNVRCFGYKLTV